MKRIIIILFCSCSIQAFCQEADTLIREIKDAIPSWKKMRVILSKYGTNHTSVDTMAKQDEFYINSYPIFLNASIYSDYYNSGDRHSGMTVGSIKVVHDNKKVLYVSIICDRMLYDTAYIAKADTLFRYIDEQYLADVLYPYNLENNTNYTWKDLFEDNVDNFNTDQGMTPGYSKMFTETLRFVKNRDHSAIRSLCFSLNPIRKTFGAVALSILKLEGEKLTNEEKKYLRHISKSNEKINFSAGCLGSKEKISDLLKEGFVNNLYTEVKHKGFL